jgi:riboflavin kinase/FMN adenylyltransferase
MPCVATVGFFDGVHRGHTYLINRVVEEAKAMGLLSVVITFDKHPREVLNLDYKPELLCTLDSKLLLLSRTGIDQVVVLPFDEKMARMSAHDFMQTILKARLNVRKLVVGYDNRFGYRCLESIDDYIRYGREMDMEVVRNQNFVLNDINVSSSVIRNYIRQGEIQLANQCLGYPYTIAGIVKGGEQEGRKIGFPTANLDTSDFGQLIPAPGVYAVKARLMQSVATKPAMMNIGNRPTFGGTHLSIETHIFNFDEDIYGQLLLVSVMYRIREEQKFDSVEDLQRQLREDRELILQQFNEDNEL